MAITKLIYQDSNEEFVRACEKNGEALCSLIETESGIKSASSQLVSKSLLEEYRPRDSHTACIHLIAMGASDYYGFNRNGDWFSSDVLEKTANTFVTHGHMFREHRNKDPKKAIGSVKWAGYDGGPDGMKRVELIVHMDKDKAEEEYEMAKKGSALNFSMSCRVPNDRCSCCGNKAKTVANYCPHLSRNMGRYVDEFNKYAFAYNDEPTFFDISRVRNPADRIARHLEYMFEDKDDAHSKAASIMCKAASASDVPALLPSALCAEYEGVNLDVLGIEEQNMMMKLASSEEFVSDPSNRMRIYTDARANAAIKSFPYAMMEKLSAAELEACRNVNPGTLFRELAKRACVLSFPAFCQYITGREDITDAPLFKKAAMLLPRCFKRMTCMIMKVKPCEEFCPCSEHMAEMDPGHTDLVQKFMDGMEEKFSLREEPVRRRVMTIIIKGAPAPEHNVIKLASLTVNNEEATGLADLYGLYQANALVNIREARPETFNETAVCDLIAGANSIADFT